MNPESAAVLARLNSVGGEPVRARDREKKAKNQPLRGSYRSRPSSEIGSSRPMPCPSSKAKAIEEIYLNLNLK